MPEVARGGLTIRGLDEKLGEMDGLAERAKNMQPALEAAGARISKFVDDRFRSATDPTGEPWEPLAASTIAGRRKGKGGKGGKRKSLADRVLQDTGRLKSSITYQAGAKTLRFGTNVEYAGAHQDGTEDIPRRAFLPVVRVGHRYVLEESGPAGELWRKVRDGIVEYVRTGRVR